MGVGRPRLTDKRIACSFSLNEEEQMLIKGMAEEQNMSASACVSKMIRETSQFGNLPLTLYSMKDSLIDMCRAIISSRKRDIEQAQIEIDQCENLLGLLDTITPRLDAIRDIAGKQSKLESEVSTIEGEQRACESYLKKNLNVITSGLDKPYEDYIGNTQYAKFDAYHTNVRRKCYLLNKLGFFTNPVFSARAEQVRESYVQNATRYAESKNRPVDNYLFDPTDSAFYGDYSDYCYQEADKLVKSIRSGNVLD